MKVLVGFGAGNAVQRVSSGDELELVLCMTAAAQLWAPATFVSLVPVNENCADWHVFALAISAFDRETRTLVWVSIWREMRLV